MFDIGWTELLVIGIVALIVVGPKDLPGMFRALGQFTAKVKRMAREFSSAMEAAADEAGVGEVEKTLRAAANPKKMGVDALKKAVDPSKYKPGSETQKLAEERAAAAKKIHEATAKKEAEKRAAEAAAAEAPAAKKPASKSKAKPAPKPKAAKPKAAATKAKAPAKTAAKAKPKAKPAAKKAT